MSFKPPGYTTPKVSGLKLPKVKMTSTPGSADFTKTPKATTPKISGPSTRKPKGDMK